METVDTSNRLSKLRQLMKSNDVALYIVPSEDSHQSEYIAPTDARREFICGFSGSAGTAIVALDKAALATDGRYFNQAEKQLDSNWELLKIGLQDVPSWQDWTANNAKDGKAVGVDPRLITAGDARRLDEKIKSKGGAGLKAVDRNLIDEIWKEHHPAPPKEKVMVLEDQFTGKKFLEKLTDLRGQLEKKERSGFIVSMLDEIAWLYNLRGNDIPYNPVFFSYSIVTSDKAVLYVDKNKLPTAVTEHLESAVDIKPYHDIFKDLKAFGQNINVKRDKGENDPQKFLISKRGSWALTQAIGDDNVEEIRSPIGDAKAVKNETELKGMRECHIRDGAALIQYFAWLQNELTAKGSEIDEVQGADKLESFRAEQENFMGPSFDTISSTGSNAAVIHYKPEPGSCKIIDPKAIYLCDSGAQYKDGTTDTTRTLHFGEPTDMERKAYTLVLKGNIALERVIFPKGTTGYAIDTLARQFLWAQGLDYRHGTGHGVGSFLNVHEGPIGIGTRINYSEVPLDVGNVVSNEPGYYEDGSFGVRIENIIMVKKTETKHSFGDKPFLGFENVTMVPMCRKLIDVSLLTQSEKDWLNKTNQTILEKTKSLLAKNELAKKWLASETAPY